MGQHVRLRSEEEHEAGSVLGFGFGFGLRFGVWFG